ncbi:SPOR domain-containing protein [Vandammella animalimorsus]|uniref:SPOR domain-containing protein n=1 Tax=Vandammella animalimorsus TaxID=2029117 RepID=A0A3M6RIG5_9BURK|nr:SPOR domain-containing protein [Vandammella animalimorsus]RMX15195.1 SPOR domain-containing protein [Vandammella animalimorsus]
MALFDTRAADSGAESTGQRTRGARAPVNLLEDMRRRARHRLIGACLLVLVAIVVFPMLFDTEPRPTVVDARVSILGGETAPAAGDDPAQVAVLTPSGPNRYGLADDEELMDLDALPPARAGRGQAGTAQQSAADKQPAAARGKPQPAQEPRSLAAQRAQEARQPAPKPESKPAEAKPAETKPRGQPEAKPAESKPAPKQEANKPSSKPEAKPESKPEASKPAESKPARPTQVAVATPPPAPAAKPAADRDEAARARALLEGKPVATTTPAGRSDEGRFIVQIGAFSDDAKVREIRQKLQGMGLRTYTQVVQTGAGRATRVRVGPFASRAEADRAAERVRGASLPAAIVSM